MGRGFNHLVRGRAARSGAFLLALGLLACSPTSPSVPEGGEGPGVLPGPSPREPVFKFPGEHGPGGPLPDLTTLEGESKPPIARWVFSQTRPVSAPWAEALELLPTKIPGIQTGAPYQCLAHELARAMLREGWMGDNRFRIHLAIRCGLSSSDVAVQGGGGETSPGLSDERVWSVIPRDDVSNALEAIIRGRPTGVGIALAREGRKVGWIVVGYQSQLSLEAAVVAPDASHLVHIRGSSKAPMDQVKVVINQGQYGYQACNTAATEHDFQATCPMAPSDEEARYEVLTAASDGLLYRIAARGLARRTPLSQSYVRAPDLADPPGRPFALAAADELNSIRKAAGLAPIPVSAPQSEIAAQFLPHLATTLTGSDSARERELTLGLHAGWGLKADIRDGQSYFYGAATKSGRTWIRECLESPTARDILLDPGADILSLAAIPWGAAGTFGAASIHKLYKKEDTHKADVDLVLRRLHRARVAAGRAPFEIAPPNPELLEAAQSVRDDGVAPEGAVAYAAWHLAQQVQGEVHGLHVEGLMFDGIVFPEDLLRLPSGTIRTVVTHYHPDHSPWAQMSLLLLVESE